MGRTAGILKCHDQNIIKKFILYNGTNKTKPDNIPEKCRCVTPRYTGFEPESDHKNDSICPVCPKSSVVISVKS